MENYNTKTFRYFMMVLPVLNIFITILFRTEYNTEQIFIIDYVIILTFLTLFYDVILLFFRIMLLSNGINLVYLLNSNFKY